MPGQESPSSPDKGAPPTGSPKSSSPTVPAKSPPGSTSPTSPPKSPTSPSKTSPETSPKMTPSSRAARPPLTKQSSVDKTKVRLLDRADSGFKRQQFQNRRHSSFDLPHIDGFRARPDIRRLSTIEGKDQVPWWTSSRFGLAVLCFWGFAALYAQRVNLSIAIVTMVTHPHHNVTHNVTYNFTEEHTTLVNLTVEDDPYYCPALEKKHKKNEFEWSKELQGLILGAFFWGYLVLQVPGGWLAERYGAKKVVAIAMFPVAVLNIISPPAARLSPYLFIVVRILVGLGEGVMYPAAQALWANWAPPNERSRLIGFSYAGGQFGNALIFPIGGVLCAYGFDGGWASVFYVIGGLGFLWCILWVIFAHDRPDLNPRISQIEKKYIEFSLNVKNKPKRARNTPWKAIFTARVFWAIIIVHTCGNYGAYMLLTQIPTYMKEVLKFDIKSNGAFSMLPYLNFWLHITIASTVADLLITRKVLSVTWTRKLMTTLGTVGPAVFLVATGFMECYQQTLAVVMLTFAVGLCGFHFSGYFINHCDIAAPHAGTLFGITNTAATVPGILAPFVVGALTRHGTRAEWQTAFYVAAGVYCVGALVYLLLGSGEPQPWAQDTTADTADDEDDSLGGPGLELDDIRENEEEETNGKTPNGHDMP